MKEDPDLGGSILAECPGSPELFWLTWVFLAFLGGLELPRWS